MVSDNNKTRRKQVNIISSTANFCVNADFLSIGLSGKHGQIPEVRFQPSPKAFLLRFDVITTSMVIRSEFEPLNGVVNSFNHVVAPPCKFEHIYIYIPLLL